MNTYLYQQITKKIEDKIISGEYLPNDKLPSEIEFAMLFDVSVITTKKALEMLVQKGLITRTRGKGTFVNGTSKEIIAKPSTASNKKIVGVIYDGYSGSFGDQLMAEIEHEMLKSNMTFITRNSLHSEDAERAILEEMVDFNVDAIIIVPVDGEKYNPKLMKLILDDFPIIVVDRKYSKFDTCYVGTDHFKASFDLAKHMLDSHDKVCFAKQEKNHDSLYDRLRGIEDAFIDSKITSSNLSVLKLDNFDEFSNKETLGSIVSSAADFLERNNIKRVFASDYNIAVIIEQAFKEIGMSCPKDCQITCFDSTYDIFGNYFFTHIKQDQKTIAKKTVSLLREILNSPNIEKKQILVDAHIKIGESC